MRPGQDILLGVAGQLLVLDVIHGRPSSVTRVEVRPWDSSDDDDAEEALTGAGTIEASPNTTTDADAGAGQGNPNRIPLTSTDGAIAGRVYLLTGADQVREFVELDDVDAGDAVFAKSPLRNPYAAGATFQSTRITATLDTDWVSDEDNLTAPSPAPGYRVTWEYVVAGETKIVDTYFSLVRYVGQHNVTPADMERRFPGLWMRRLPSDNVRDQGRGLIDSAYDAVRFDLYEIHKDDAAIADASVIDELVRYKAIAALEFAKFIGGSSDDERRVDRAEKAYTNRFDKLVRVVDNVPERDETAAAAPPVRTPMTYR